MTKFKRILLFVSCVVVSLCFVLSAFVLGSYYNRSRSVYAAENSELVGTWVFNDSFSISEDEVNTFLLSFSSNSFTFSSIVLKYQRFVFSMEFHGDDGTKLAWSSDNPDSSGWWDENYKTIQITDVSSLTNETEFTSWLTANAVKQGQSSDYDEGYSAGYADGVLAGYDNGYTAGQSDGYENGYNNGYTVGYNAGLSDTLDNPVSFFLSPLNSFMSIDFFGQFSFGDVFSVILFVSLGLIVIKMFAGG